MSLKKELVMIKLENRMESIRKEMITSGLVKGLCHPDTLKSSRRLDTILNRYERVRSIR